MQDTITTYEYDESGALVKRVTKWKEPSKKSNIIVETFTYTGGRLTGYTKTATIGEKTTMNGYKVIY